MNNNYLPLIGKINLETPFLLAPIAGVTDSSFRKICRELGAAMVYSEMVSANGLFFGDQKTKRLLRFHESEKPLAFQIFGRDPQRMAYAAKVLDEYENAILDVNMGCPVPKVVKNGEGSALLKEPKLAGDIIKRMTSATSKPVTVKIRTGWDSQSINTVEIAKIIEDSGAAAIAVHGRTREQFYSGKADWEIISLVKDAVKIPIIGNGDVFSHIDAVRMLKETGCDFVMIARGALGNPWIFRESNAAYEHTLTESVGSPECQYIPKPVTLKEKLDMLRRHFQMMITEIGEYASICQIRKHAAWYLKGIRGSAEVKRNINTVADAGAFINIINKFEQK